VQDQRRPTPGQIAQGPFVRTMDTVRTLSAEWACHRAACGREVQREASRLRSEGVKVEATALWQEHGQARGAHTGLLERGIRKNSQPRSLAPSCRPLLSARRWKTPFRCGARTAHQLPAAVGADSSHLFRAGGAEGALIGADVGLHRCKCRPHRSAQALPRTARIRASFLASWITSDHGDDSCLRLNQGPARDLDPTILHLAGVRAETPYLSAYW
jgi:hypothetical protein